LKEEEEKAFEIVPIKLEVKDELDINKEDYEPPIK